MKERDLLYRFCRYMGIDVSVHASLEALRLYAASAVTTAKTGV